MEVSGEARKKANLSYYYRNRNEILAKRVAKRLEQKLVKAILKNGIHKRVIWDQFSYLSLHINRLTYWYIEKKNGAWHFSQNML